MEKVKFSYIILLLAGSICAVAALATRKECTYKEYRLPKRVQPEHYDLMLDVDTESFKYTGKVGIDLKVGRDGAGEDQLAANVIVLHANATVGIDEVQFNGLDNAGTNGIESICRFEENELLVVTLKDELAEGSRGQLIIGFHADISDDPNYLKGFYRDTYKSGHKVVSTQFEAASARRAFPCFDEPEFKATFDVTLVHDPKLVALSNGAITAVQIDTETGRKTTSYKRSPRMSTYLVAFVIGELDYIGRVVSNGRITLRAYTEPGKVGEAKLALDTAVRAINLMEEYFDIPFAMDKIDMVGLPNMDMSAMENWGLIHFENSVFLHDSRGMGAWEQGSVVAVLVHELAHQWFGNLVTMRWWNDLWLNEGFAKWMESYITERLYPEYEWDQAYILRELFYVLKLDMKPDVNACQVERDIRNPDSAFNSIVYKKTNAILRFLHDDYLGPERFREGIRKYIKDHQYGNTEAADLWDTLRATSGLPVDEVMRSWLTQPGHPEVEIKLVEKDGRTALGLRQKRYLEDYEMISDELKEKVSTQKWLIPLNIIIADDKGNSNKIKSIMDATETQIELPEWFDASNSNHWIKLNEGYKGFYRVQYPRDLLMRLEKPSRSKTLETADRLNLLFDIFFGSNKDLLESSDLADILTWFNGDQEGSIKLLQEESLNKISKEKFAPEKASELTGSFYRSYIKTYERYGFKIDPSETSLPDMLAISMMYLRLVQWDYQPIVEDALRAFDESGGRIHYDLKLAIYWAVSKRGSPIQKAKLKKLRDESRYQEEISLIDNFLPRGR